MKSFFSFIVSISPVLILHVGTNVDCSGGKNSGTFQNKPAVTAVRCIPRIIGVLPHDTTSFTQGLVYSSGRIYESAGLYNKSRLIVTDTAGTTLESRSLPSMVFAEGCAIFSDKLYQLTWREGICFVYSLTGIVCIDTILYGGEGWGLTSDGVRLIMSNGTDTLYYCNSRLKPVSKIAVTFNGKPLSNLNELEFVNNRIYANVWYSDYIFEINPQNGIAERFMDCSEIMSIEQPASPEHVLNGIAYNPGKNIFYITGKKWRHVFAAEIPAR